MNEIMHENFDARFIELEEKERGSFGREVG